MPYCGFIEEGSVQAAEHGVDVRFLSFCDPEILRFGNIFRRAFPKAQVAEMKVEYSFRLETGQPEHRCLVSIKPPLPSTAMVQDLLTLLIEHITIADSCDECHALGMHKSALADDEGFVHTDIGRLTYKAKPYRAYDGDESTAHQIGAKMIGFVEKHPSYARAGCVITAPPSNKEKRFDLPSLLAQDLSQAFGLDVVGTRQTRQVRPQKGIDDLQQLTLNRSGSVVIDSDLRGASVMLVDDIYRSGQTLRDTARACRTAGAAEVVALVATKTMKFAQGMPY